MGNKRLLVFALVLISVGIAGAFLTPRYSGANLLQGGGMPGVMQIMMGNGMMGNRSGMGGMMDSMTLITKWMNGETLPVDLGSPRPRENGNSIKAGGVTFKEKCSVCHGLKGDGNGEKAKDLLIKPRDFTYAVFKFRSTPTGSLPTDEDIFKTVSRGLHGTGMLPWTGLSTLEKWQVTYYVKSLSEFFLDEEKPVAVKIPAKIKTAWKYVNEGKGVYEKAKCRVCHGREGYGDGEKADKLKDDWFMPIKPTNFREGVLKRGLEIEDIYLTIATGLSGTPMPSYSTALTEDEMFSLAYYVRSLSPEPPGGGMMAGMMNLSRDEKIGMMTDMPGMPGMSMGGGMMMQRTPGK